MKPEKRERKGGRNKNSGENCELEEAKKKNSKPEQKPSAWDPDPRQPGPRGGHHPTPRPRPPASAAHARCTRPSTRSRALETRFDSLCQ